MQVLQLYVSGSVSRTWIDGAGRDMVTWAQPWDKFLQRHAASFVDPTKKHSSIQPTAERTAANHHVVIADSLQYERELGSMGIVVLLDATSSMSDAIAEVKDKIKTQLLAELQQRWIVRGAFTYKLHIMHIGIGEALEAHIAPFPLCKKDPGCGENTAAIITR